MWQAIQERYSDLDIISGPDFEVQFKEDIISLEIPEDGLQSNGWEIRPLVPPAVSSITNKVVKLSIIKVVML